MQHRLVATVRAGRYVPSPVVYASALAWLLLIAIQLMGAGAIIRHDRLLVGGPPLWLATLFFIAGWQVMLWAMMVPASINAFALARTMREIVQFAVGYFAVWTAFGIVIFFGDAALHWFVARWLWLGEHPWLIAGTVLVASGTYQLSTVKQQALIACQSLSHLSPPAKHALGSGAAHGLQCLGSSGALMLLCFALAPGSLVAMAALAVFMAFEVRGFRATVMKPLGYGLVAVGVLVLYGPIQLPG